MANRKRSRGTSMQARPTRQRSLWKSTVVLAVPLVTGTAVVTVAISELTPAPANASTKPGLLSGVLPTSLPTLLPSPKPTQSSGSGSGSGGLLPSLPNVLPSLLPSSHSSPAPSSQSSPAPAPSRSGSSGHKGSARKHSGAAPKRSAPAPAPVSMPWGTVTTPGALPQTHNAVGYVLPVPESLVSAKPALIGEGSPAPRQAQPAGPVTLAVPPGTPVNAVTAGTFKVIGSTVVLTGADGATYTYKNVTGAVRSGAVRSGAARSGQSRAAAGTKLGTAGPGGLTFSISVPDVKGPVDADEAMQAWASGLTINVRSLPSTIAPAVAPVRGQVLAVTDSGAQGLSGALSKSLAGPLVAVHTAAFDGATAVLSSAGHSATGHGSAAHALRSASPLARRIAAPGASKLVIVTLSNGTPTEAAALAALLPAGHQMLWVAPPGTTGKQAAAYQAIAAAHPAFRFETLPPALAPSSGKGGPAWAPAGQQAAGTLTAGYATTAYRLYTISSEADTTLNWAELQLGKPYKWGAAGPDSFDCSGLVMDALTQAGLTVPHNANAQWQQTRTHLVPETQLKPGDLVFFTGSDGTPASPGHVGIYAGNGQVLDAPHTGAPVRFDPLSGINGYVGATDPYSAAGAPGSGALAAAQFAGLGVPSALSQYQAFARQLSGATWGPSQFPFLYLLWQRESGWNPAALNPLSGAFGIPQSLPAGKMSAAGLDWATDPYTQIIWGIGYISSAYGNPQAAWAHEVAFGWY